MTIIPGKSTYGSENRNRQATGQEHRGGTGKPFGNLQRFSSDSKLFLYFRRIIKKCVCDRIQEEEEEQEKEKRDRAKRELQIDKVVSTINIYTS